MHSPMFAPVIALVLWTFVMCATALRDAAAGDRQGGSRP